MRWAFLLIAILVTNPIALLGAELFEFPANETEIKVPLVRAGESLFVPVKVNGGDPVLFQLDTGAPTICVTEQFAAEHKFASVGEVISNGKRAWQTALAEVEIGGVKLRQSTATVIDTSPFGSTNLKNGLIGGTFLRNVPFTIDWSQATLTLHRNRPVLPLGAREIPVWMMSDLPCISATPGGGISGWFILDTGCDSGFVLEPSFARWNQDWLTKLPQRLTRSAFLSGQRDFFSGRAINAQIAGMPLPIATVDYPLDFKPDATLTPPLAGLIGQRVLHAFRITLDYKNKLAWITPNPAGGVPTQWSSPQFNPRDAYMSGTTTLIQAARFKDTENVKRFISAGALIESKDQLGMTSLHYAIDADSVSSTELLLNAGATVDATEQVGRTALHLAAEYGDFDTARLLVQHGAKIDALDGYGGSALILAANSGNAELVSMLIEAGANLEIVDSGYGTALSAAAMRGRAEVIKLLLEAGASIEKTDKDNTPLILQAAAGNAAELVQLLLARGVDVNVRSQRGRTALMAAAKRGRTEIIRILLDHNADLSIKDNESHTALTDALDSGELASTQILFTRQTSPTSQPAEAIMAKPEFPPGKTEAVIPLRRAGDLLLVPVRINGADAGFFYLDTGMSGIVIDTQFAQEQNFPVVGEATIDGNKRTLVALNQLDIGGVKFDQTLATSVDLSRQGLLPGARGAHGILGGAFLKQIPFAINWSAPRLTLYQAQPRVPADAVPVPIWLLNDRPAINLSFTDRVSGWFVLNSGGQGGFESNTEFGRAHAEWFDALQPRIEVTTLRSSGPTDQPANRLFKIQDVEFATLPAPSQEMFLPWVTSADSSAPAAGSVGNATLKNFELYFDYNARSAWIRIDPNQGWPESWRNPTFDPRSADLIRFTPLMRAAKMGLSDQVKRFISAGADLNATDKFGNTAMHFAAENADPAIMQLLVDSGALLEAKNSDNITPLLAAAASGNVSVIQWLLKHNADQKAVDRYGRNAISLAIAGGSNEARAILLKARNGTLPQ